MGKAVATTVPWTDIYVVYCRIATGSFISLVRTVPYPTRIVEARWISSDVLALLFRVYSPNIGIQTSGFLRWA